MAKLVKKTSSKKDDPHAWNKAIQQLTDSKQKEDEDPSVDEITAIAMAHAKKQAKKQEKLEEKYLGKKRKPLHKGYWKDGIKPHPLTIDGVKYVNLGKGCEKTLMFHFDNEPPSRWEIAEHFKKCK